MDVLALEVDEWPKRFFEKFFVYSVRTTHFTYRSFMTVQPLRWKLSFLASDANRNSSKYVERTLGIPINQRKVVSRQLLC